MSDKNIEQEVASLVGKLNSAGDFAIDQLPEVLSQFLLAERINLIFMLIVGILILYFFTYKTYLKIANTKGMDEDRFIMLVVFTGITGFVGLTMLLSGLSNLEVFYAPKWYIIKYFI